MTDAKILIEEMLGYKESLGRKRGTYETHLSGLAEFLDNRNLSTETVSLVNDILPWCAKRPSESSSGLRRRLAAVREFTKYLYALGKCDGVLSLDELPSYTQFVPYIFSDSELAKVFEAGTNKATDPKDPFAREIIAVIYQLIYFCGLRPNEGRGRRFPQCFWNSFRIRILPT